MQTKRDSMIESAANVVVGVSIAWVCNLVVLPLFGYKVTLADGLGISVVFTGVSLARSYCLRRLFNSRVHKQTKGKDNA